MEFEMITKENVINLLFYNFSLHAFALFLLLNNNYAYIKL